MTNNILNKWAKSIHRTKQKEMNYTDMGLYSFLDKALQESIPQIDLYSYAKQISHDFDKSMLPYLIKLVAQYSDNLSLDATIHINLQNSMSVQEKNDVIAKEKEKFAWNNMIVFKCQSIIDGRERLFEIKYELSTCKWMLFKI